MTHPKLHYLAYGLALLGLTQCNKYSVDPEPVKQGINTTEQINSFMFVGTPGDTIVSSFTYTDGHLTGIEKRHKGIENPFETSQITYDAQGIVKMSIGSTEGVDAGSTFLSVKRNAHGYPLSFTRVHIPMNSSVADTFAMTGRYSPNFQLLSQTVRKSFIGNYGREHSTDSIVFQYRMGNLPASATLFPDRLNNQFGSNFASFNYAGGTSASLASVSVFNNDMTMPANNNRFDWKNLTFVYADSISAQGWHQAYLAPINNFLLTGHTSVMPMTSTLQVNYAIKGLVDFATTSASSSTSEVPFPYMTEPPNPTTIIPFTFSKDVVGKGQAYVLSHDGWDVYFFKTTKKD